MKDMVALDFVDVPSELVPAYREAQRLVQRHFSRQWRDPFKGQHAIGGQRYFHVRGDSMSVHFYGVVRSIFSDQHHEQAERIADSLLFDLAHALGLADARAFSREMNVTDPLALVTLGPVHFAFTGWARVRILPVSNPTPGDAYLLVYDHQHNFEADAWREAGGSERPVCIMNAGYSSGWCEAAYNQPLVAVEIACEASNDEVCRFVMAPPDRIQQRVAELEVAFPDWPRNARPIEIPGFFHEKQRVATMLTRSERRFRSLFDGAPSGMALMSLRGVINEANAALADIFGVDPDALAGSPLLDLLRPEDRQGVQEALHALRDDEVSSVNRTVTARHLDGRVLTVQLRISLTRDGTDALACLLYVQDLTRERGALAELRKREQQLRQAQKLDAVGRLAGGVAHDFNSLLTIMLNAAEQIELALPEGHAGRNKAGTIVDAALRAGRLTRQLLTFSRQQVVVSRVVDLGPIVQAAVTVLKPTLGANITLNVELDPEAWAIRGDPGQLEQVAVNLLLNAKDALPAKGGEITLRVRNLNAGDHAQASYARFVRLEVIDTGAGMDEATLQHLFEPFFTTRAEGTGLGMSVAHGIVVQCGGTIQVDSQPGRGTTIKLTFPGSAEAAPEVVNAPYGTSGAETLLVVEDDPHIRAILARGLPTLGYSVHVAASAPEAFALIEALATKLDLVLTDLVLPGQSGVEVARYANERMPGVPVVYMTGYAQAPSDLPEDDQTVVVIKPFTLQSLALELRTVLEGRTRSPQVE